MRRNTKLAELLGKLVAILEGKALTSAERAVVDEAIFHKNAGKGRPQAANAAQVARLRAKGMSIGQIASELKCSTTTVWRRVNQATKATHKKGEV